MYIAAGSATEENGCDFLKIVLQEKVDLIISIDTNLDVSYRCLSNRGANSLNMSKNCCYNISSTRNVLILCSRSRV